MAALLQILVPKINDSYRHTVTYRRLALPKKPRKRLHASAYVLDRGPFPPIRHDATRQRHIGHPPTKN